MQSHPEYPQRTSQTALVVIRRRGWNDFHPETLGSLEEAELTEHDGKLFVVASGEGLAPLGPAEAFSEIPAGTFDEPLECGDTFVHPLRFNGANYVRYLVTEPAGEDAPPKAVRIVFGFSLALATHEALWASWLEGKGVETAPLELNEDQLGPEFGPMFDD